MADYFYKYTGTLIEQKQVFFPNLSQLFKAFNFTQKQKRSVYNRLSNRILLHIDYIKYKKVYNYKHNIWIDQTRHHKIERIYFYNGLNFDR